MQEVGGSIPPGSTNSPPGSRTAQLRQAADANKEQRNQCLEAKLALVRQRSAGMQRLLRSRAHDPRGTEREIYRSER